MTDAQHADLLFTGARVHTVDPGVPGAEALAVVGDRIAWIGADAGSRQWRGAEPGPRVCESRLAERRRAGLAWTSTTSSSWAVATPVSR